METSRVALIALVCVVFSSQKRIFGAEEFMRVTERDNVTLYSDCVWKSGLNPVWFRNCSHPRQPYFMISQDILHAFPTYSFVFNSSTNTHNLLITQVTESDLGLYYCALHEKVSPNKDKLYTDVYHYGNRSTRLSLSEESWVTVSPNTSTPCVSECSVSWKLMFSVCAVCVLLSSLLSSICVYCLCTHTTKEEVKPDQEGSNNRRRQRQNSDEGSEVCYASLDVKTLKKKSKKRVQRSDFSTYSEVRTEREKAAEAK